MNDYLFEFRSSGSARKFVEQTALDVGKSFRVRGVTGRRVVPHITIVGPFMTDDERRLIREFEHICIDYERMTFRFGVSGALETGCLVRGFLRSILNLHMSWSSFVPNWSRNFLRSANWEGTTKSTMFRTQLWHSRTSTGNIVQSKSILEQSRYHQSSTKSCGLRY